MRNNVNFIHTFYTNIPYLNIILMLYFRHEMTCLPLMLCLFEPFRGGGEKQGRNNVDFMWVPYLLHFNSNICLLFSSSLFLSYKPKAASAFKYIVCLNVPLTIL